MIKALLSFAVSFIAIFWIVCSAFAAGHPSFETKRYTIAGCLCVAGITLCLIGLAGARKKETAEPSESEPQPGPDPESQREVHSPPSGLSPLSPHYWGVVFGLMGVVVLFIRPLYKNAIPAPVPKAPPPAVQKLPPEPRPLPAPSAAPASVVLPKLKLQGIIYRPTNPSAIINGKSCLVGDRIEGAEIIEITRTYVSLLFAATTNFLWLHQ